MMGECDMHGKSCADEASAISLLWDEQPQSISFHSLITRKDVNYSEARLVLHLLHPGQLSTVFF
jgi:hypothetical protein